MVSDIKKNHDAQQLVDITKQIINALQNIRYGSVEITIHESRVVQIERREKMRFDKNWQAS